MGNLIQLAVDVFTAGLEEEIEIREEWKNKIFVKLLIQEWVSTKETMKLLVKALDE
jgi:predicted HTH domain antitoxin